MIGKMYKPPGAMYGFVMEKKDAEIYEAKGGRDSQVVNCFLKGVTDLERNNPKFHVKDDGDCLLIWRDK